MTETTGKLGKYQKAVGVIVLCMAVFLGLFQMLSASYGIWSSYVLCAVHWGFIGSYIVLRHPTKGGVAGRIYDWVIILLTVWVCYYQVNMQDRMIMSAGFYTALDIATAIIAALVMLEVGRRAVGNILPIICIAFLLYCYFGHYVSGMLKTTPFTISRTAIFLYTSSDGLFGQTLYVSAEYIFLFILFGCILELTGAGEFFVDLAYAAVGKARGGPAQAAVISSMLMGTINGSGAANVVTTGTFTIPLMKKIGIRPAVAGAVEAVASSGGQIMPPVMGAVAFLMAEITGIKYAQIVLAALVPACMYYITLSSSVYFIARRDHIPAGNPENMKKVRTVLKEGWLYCVPVIVLIVLIVSNMSIQMSAFYSILVTIAVGFIKNRKKMTPGNLFHACENAIRSIAPVASACVLAGMIMGAMSLTGFGLKISSLIEHLSGNSLLLTLILAMVASIFLGMGLPTSAAYLVLAILVAPALTGLGVSMMAAHLFLLYFGALSTITPPVALSVFAAVGISGAGIWETGWEAVKLASAGFIIPFIFAYDNSLLLVGSPIIIVIAVATAVVGCIILAMATTGWMIHRLHIITRLVLAATAVMVIISNPIWINVVGLILASASIFLDVKVLNKARVLNKA